MKNIKYITFFFTLFIQLKLICMTSTLLIEGKQVSIEERQLKRQLVGRRPKSVQSELKRSKSELELKRSFHRMKLKIPTSHYISLSQQLSPSFSQSEQLSPSLSPKKFMERPIWEIMTCLSPRLNFNDGIEFTNSANPIGVENSKNLQSTADTNTFKLFYAKIKDSQKQLDAAFAQKPTISFNENKISQPLRKKQLTPICDQYENLPICAYFPGSKYVTPCSEYATPYKYKKSNWCKDWYENLPIYAYFPGQGYVTPPDVVAYECKKTKLK